MGRHEDDESGVAGDKSLRRIRLTAMGATALLVGGVAFGVAQTVSGPSAGHATVGTGADAALTVRADLASATEPTSSSSAGSSAPTTSASTGTKTRGETRHHRRHRTLPTWPGFPSSKPTTKPSTSPTAVPTSPSTEPTHSTAPTTTQPAAPTTTAAPVPPAGSSFADQVLTLTNAERAKAGCNALTANATLTSVAQAHSADMAANNYFSHNSQNGTTPFQRMTAAGYSYRTAGENIAAGQSTPSAVVTAWMNSAGHRANILNCSFTQIGVGYATGGSYHSYWTQDFGTPR